MNEHTVTRRREVEKTDLWRSVRQVAMESFGGLDIIPFREAEVYKDRYVLIGKEDIRRPVTM